MEWLAHRNPCIISKQVKKCRGSLRFLPYCNAYNQNLISLSLITQTKTSLQFRSHRNHQYCTSIRMSHRQASRPTMSILPSTAVHHLHVDFLLAIFEHLDVHNMCKVEQGSSNSFFILLQSSCYRWPFFTCIKRRYVRKRVSVQTVA